ncbi:C-X-C chemokine receptor type 3-like [Gambusia affinis]|uniref:C-X-C chemokine receptor type 3-like n=1 Tax=Gambusia affinis TaxID=33528 RepID=UPI001CDC1A1E|nr:C-X-C chemokine receptor type 3-like [Gambusia affinis]
MVILGGLFNQTQPYDYPDDYEFEDEDVDKAAWIPILFSILVIVGLLGNGLLLAVLARKRRPWRVLDSFILQLGMVDILLLLTLAFYATHDTQTCGWCSQTVLRVCGAFFKINLYVGAFLLVCICLDQCLFSIHADRCRSHRTSLAILGCLLTWIISITLAVLDWIFLVNTESMPGKALSAHSHPKTKVDWQLISHVLHLGVGFLLPALIQIVFCSHIMIQCKSNCRSRMKAVLFILSLVGVFLLCWTPYNITLLIDTISYTSKDFLKNFFVDHINSLKAAVKVTSAVSCISACVRPPLYFLFCGNFRKAVFSIFTCAKVECKSSLWELSMEAPHDQCRSEQEMKQMMSA